MIVSIHHVIPLILPQCVKIKEPKDEHCVL